MRTFLVGLALLASACITGGINDPGMVPGGQAPYYTVTVHVDDSQRRPLGGAIVEFDGTRLLPTDAFGRTTGRVVRGKHTLRVTAEGFQPQLWSVEVLGDWQYGLSLEQKEEEWHSRNSEPSSRRP